MSGEERSRALLMANISPAMMTADGRYLVVRGQLTKQTYYIPYLIADHVRLPALKVHFCAYPKIDYCYRADRALALALYIQHDERKFLRTACSSSSHPNNLALTYIYLRARMFLSIDVFSAALCALGAFMVGLSLGNLLLLYLP